MKIIEGHSDYTVTQDGRVIRTTGARTQRPLKQSFHKINGYEYPNGYMYVTLLSKDGSGRGSYPIAVHRIIATAYIPNDQPTLKLWVNHKDGNKLNNSLENLEWTTPAENIQHSFNDLGRKRQKQQGCPDRMPEGRERERLARSATMRMTTITLSFLHK